MIATSIPMLVPLTWILVAAPVSAFAVTGMILLLELPVPERVSGRITLGAIATSLLCALGILALLIAAPERSLSVELGRWIVLADADYSFSFRFVFDRLSLPFLILSLVLGGIVGSFARSYLHREDGYRRFQLLYLMFVLGMVVSAVAGTIETLFAGWELVGLSSVLLVGFYQERSSAVRNGLRVWTVYRFADAAFLIAAVALHHVSGDAELHGLAGSGAWPDGVVPLTPGQATGIGALLLIAAAGKSALIPFSGWLPRAMEGPTPSSAIFYGALSVHLGAFLLLRVEPLLDLSVTLSALVVVLGLATAVYAGVATRVQTDIKGALALASLTQVGLIVAEIGFGLRTLALVHLCGNACLRTLQLLRAPSLLHDYHQLELAIGSDLPAGAASAPSRGRDRIVRTMYAFGFARGLFDDLLARIVVGPFLRTFRTCNAIEERWSRKLGSGKNADPVSMVGPEEVARWH